MTTTSSASGRRTRYTPSCWIVCTRTGPRWSGSSARAVCSSSCSPIVHELWASNDTSPLILPGNVPLEATTVNTDLTQYLEDQWKPIIDSDIDGPGSMAQQIDLDRPNLGQPGS